MPSARSSAVRPEPRASRRGAFRLGQGGKKLAAFCLLAVLALASCSPAPPDDSAAKSRPPGRSGIPRAETSPAGGAAREVAVENESPGRATTPKRVLAPATVPDCRRRDLSLGFSLNKRRYQEGERVRMRLSARNVSARACQVTFNDSQRFDFVVTRGGSPIWRYGYCPGNFPTVINESWKRGYEEMYAHSWNQRKRTDADQDCDGGGDTFPPGTYRAVGEFRGLRNTAGLVRTSPIDFVIESGDPGLLPL